MTQISGSITIEGRKLEEAVAETVDRVLAERLAPMAGELRRLAALAEAEIVGAPEAAKILMAAGAATDLDHATHMVANLARMGYRFALIDPDADTREVPLVAPAEPTPAPGTPWTEGAEHKPNCPCVHCALKAEPESDRTWAAQFE